MTIRDRLNKKLEEAPANSIIIIDVDTSDWYEILEQHVYSDRTILLRRFHNEFTIVTEKELNDMGWFHQ